MRENNQARRPVSRLRWSNVGSGRYKRVLENTVITIGLTGSVIKREKRVSRVSNYTEKLIRNLLEQSTTVQIGKNQKI